MDRLRNGRLRLGIGVGWNQVEYEGLNENFHDRGKRSGEQIALIRALWTQDVIEFDSRLHQVREAGISPSPEPITPMDQRAGMH
ncbi:MAG: LLM class flavin-dependent oxidoreductase [Arenicellales bacterium]|nr:LLM class flavin-dependent oxidoreductase [Arenicellales bacterium]